MDDVGVPHFGKPPGHVLPIPISHFDDHLSHWLSATSCSWEAYTPLWVNSELLLSHAKLKIGTVIKISGWDWDPFCGCTYHSWLYTYLRLLSHCVPMVVGHTYAFWPPITSVGPQTNYGYQWSAHQSVQLIYFWWGCYILPFPPLGDTPLQFTILMMTNTPYGPIVPLHVKPSIQGAREGVLSTVSDGHLHITSHNHGEKNTHQHCQHWYFWKMPRKMLNQPTNQPVTKYVRPEMETEALEEPLIPNRWTTYVGLWAFFVRIDMCTYTAHVCVHLILYIYTHIYIYIYIYTSQRERYWAREGKIYTYMYMYMYYPLEIQHSYGKFSLFNV